MVRFVPAKPGSRTTPTTRSSTPTPIDEIPYEGDRIDLGEATVEQLALGLDPFPRRPGVRAAPRRSTDADSAPAAEPAADHPSVRRSCEKKRRP